MLRSVFGRVDTCFSGSNVLTAAISTGQITERTGGNIRSDLQDVVHVSFQTRGRGGIKYYGRQAVLSAGDFAVFHTTQPYRLCFDADFEQLAKRLPREALERTMPRQNTRTMCAMIGRRGPGRVLA